MGLWTNVIMISYHPYATENLNIRPDVLSLWNPAIFGSPDDCNIYVINQPLCQDILLRTFSWDFVPINKMGLSFKAEP